MKPSYRFLEHTADVLFQAEALTPTDLFEQCALALEETQVDTAKVEPKKEVTITGQNKNLEMLLFDFLDNLLFYKDAEQLVFGRFEAKIEKKNEAYHLTCRAYGEKLDNRKHNPKVDVKAVTLHLFEVKKVDGIWKAQVLLDV